MASNRSYAVKAKRIIQEMGAAPGWSTEQVEMELRKRADDVADAYACVLTHEFISLAAVADAYLKRRVGQVTAATASTVCSQICRELFDGGLLRAKKSEGKNPSLMYKRCEHPLLVPEHWPGRQRTNGVSRQVRRSDQITDATPEQCLVRMNRTITAMERSMDAKIDAMIRTLGTMQGSYREAFEELREIAEETRGKTTTSGALQAELRSVMARLEGVIQH